MRRSRAQTSPYAMTKPMAPPTESPPTCSCTTPICRAPVQHRMVYLHNDEDTLDVMAASTLVATALMLTPVTTLQAASISTTPLRSLLVLGSLPALEASAKKQRSRSLTWLNGLKRSRTCSIASQSSEGSAS